MHFGFASQAGNTLAKSAAIATYRLPQRFIAIEDGSETEGKDRAGPETYADHSCVFQDGLVVQFSGRAVVLADDYSKFAAGIAHHRGLVDTLNAFQQEGAPRARTIEGALLSEAICVPRHTGFSPYLSRDGFSASGRDSWSRLLNLGSNGRYYDWIERLLLRPNSYYFGTQEKCNPFVAGASRRIKES